MYDPYRITLGPMLYMDLWDDPNRPENTTVELWAQILLNRALHPEKEE
jgi:hypothetical protein